MKCQKNKKIRAEGEVKNSEGIGPQDLTPDDFERAGGSGHLISSPISIVLPSDLF